MNIETAKDILEEWTEGAALLRHAHTVSEVMRHYAIKFGEDPEQWAITGLLHDADYEKFPQDHPNRIVAKLRDMGEEQVAYAISAHYTKWGNPASSLLDKALLAVDELTGFIVACAQVRPQGFDGMKPKSVIKKLKQRSFAAKVDRDEINIGVELLGVTMHEHLEFIIAVLSKMALELDQKA